MLLCRSERPATAGVYCSVEPPPGAADVLCRAVGWEWALEAVLCPEVACRAGEGNLFYPAWLIMCRMTVLLSLSILPRRGVGRRGFGAADEYM